MEKSRIKYLLIKWIAFPSLFVVGYIITFFANIGCIWKHFFGIICPGCGLTRALLSICFLDVKSAFSFHPMFWSFPILLLYYIRDGRLFKNKLLNRIVILVILLGFLVTWIYRVLMGITL